VTIVLAVLVAARQTAHVVRKLAEHLMANILGTIARDSEDRDVVIPHLILESNLVTQKIDAVAGHAPTNSAETVLAGPEGLLSPRDRKSTS